MKEKNQKKAIDNTLNILAESIRKYKNDGNNNELLKRVDELIKKRNSTQYK